MPFVTYQDAIDHLVDYLGGGPTDSVLRDCRRAVLEAYRDLANAFRWTYLLTHGRVVTSGPYRDGAVAYDQATRRAILTGGTWPAWAAGGYIRVALQAWKVAERSSDTVVILDDQVNPGTDVDFAPAAVADALDATPIVIAAPAHGLATGDVVVVEDVGGNLAANGTWTVTVIDAGSLSLDASAGSAAYTTGGTWRRAPTTSYALYRDGYLLPADFVGGDRALYERTFGGMEYVHPREWLFEERYVLAEGTPRYYTITGDRTVPGRLLIRLCPYPTELKTVDFLYHRRPRPLAYAAESAGKASVAMVGALSLTGTGTAFVPAMVGSVLRLSATAVRPPTAAVGGLAGVNPPAHETLVIAVDSATMLRFADPCPVALAGVAYTIGDPIDLELGAMLNAFWRCCEHHASLNRTLKDKPSARQAYLSALAEARAADSRSFSGRSVGDHAPLRQRLRDMPINFNEVG